MLREAIELLPSLPDTDSLDEVAAFLRQNLRFSAAQSRQRAATQVDGTPFPEPIAVNAGLLDAIPDEGAALEGAGKEACPDD